MLARRWRFQRGVNRLKWSSLDAILDAILVCLRPDHGCPAGHRRDVAEDYTAIFS
jgi:hypothetical protein